MKKWHEEPARPITLVRKNQWGDVETDTYSGTSVWDEFAKAAISGLLSISQTVHRTADEYANDAANIADAVMEERDKRRAEAKD